MTPSINRVSSLPILQDRAIGARVEVAVLYGCLIVGRLQTRIVVQGAAQNETEAGSTVVAAANEVGVGQLEELDEHRLVGGEADIIAPDVGF